MAEPTPPPPLRRHLAVLGSMGVGKSSTAERLADALGVGWRDSDGDLEALFGCHGRDISATSGVDVLHRLEEAVLLGALAHPEPMVVSAAASVVESSHCLDALARRATVVWLTLPADVVRERARRGHHRRRIDADEWEAITRRREPAYRAVADIVTDASPPPHEVAADVLARLDDGPLTPDGGTRPS